ncbi:hypothetical protein JCM15519_24150 [Fundidesulfovibrio butyratiphilus]
MDAALHTLAGQGRAPALLRTLLANCREGVMLTDAHGAIVLVNAAFTAITGYEPREVVGQSPKVLSCDRNDRAFFLRMRKSLEESGRWEGEIWNRHKSGEAYPEWLSICALHDEQGTLSGHLAVFQDLSDQKRRENLLLAKIHHDALTGLPDRHLFLDRLRRAVRSMNQTGAMAAVICLNLDRFRLVNDSLGHLAGDVVLARVAKRLSGFMRQSDTLSRFGGDSFYLLLGSLRDPGDAAHVAGRILTRLAAPMRIDDQEHFVSASLGVCVAPTDGDTPEQLLQHAETAMHRAKEAGRNTYVFFTEELGNRASRSLRLENDLRKALSRREFVLHYQPCVNIRTGRVTGMEALVRWIPPDGRVVSPEEFIPLAEEIGLMPSLGRFVLAEACRAAGEWRKAGHGPLKLAVNLSTRQLGQKDLIDFVWNTLERNGLSPSALELEVTESAFLSDYRAATAFLGRMAQAGVGVALDDFGTGYSCLAYLKRLPITTLKIDKSFISGLPTDREDEGIVRSVLSLADHLGLTTVTEGVETRDQLECLLSLGCRGGCQGYLFSRPLPEQEFTLRLRSGWKGLDT